MKKNKKLTNALFVVLLIGCLLAASAAIRPKKNDVYDIVSVERMLEQVEVEPENSLDALFVGDSLVYTTYSPVQMYGENGFTSFNLGTTSQHLCDSYALLDEIYEDQNPQLVVLDLNGAFDRYDAFTEKEQQDLTIFGKLLPVLHYHEIYKLLTSPKELLKKTDPTETFGYINKGFNSKNGVVKYEGRADYMKPHEGSMEKEEPQENAESKETAETAETAETQETAAMAEGASESLEKIIALCKEHNTQVLLVSTPSPINWNYEKVQLVSQWAKEHNTDFLDMNTVTDIAIDWATDSVDGGDHLNIKGAEKVSAYIGKYIAENYKLPDHRTDSAYQSWTDLSDAKAAEQAEKKEGHK